MVEVGVIERNNIGEWNGVIETCSGLGMSARLKGNESPEV